MIAIYPGSFDPITNGHLDIITRAKKLCTTLIVGVIQNPNKIPLFSIEERIGLIRSSLSDQTDIVIEGFDGLLVDFARRHQSQTIIRGLRAVSDFDYEFQMALTNRHLHGALETVFFMTDQHYSYLSSSMVRQLAKHHRFLPNSIPESVKKALEEKFAHE